MTLTQVSNLQFGQYNPDRKKDWRRIKTQQGFSQHILELSEDDAKIYTDLLTRNKIWWADVTEKE
jgi:hypothetical protein